jgi:DNA-directed RNA polymerase sigma subunit (sigma70/sigma32)
MRARLHRFIAGNTKRKHAAVIVSTETQLGEDFTLADTLTADVEAQDDSYEAAERAHAVRRLVALLRNDLDRQAIEGRLRGETLQTIGDKLGVSREYVRQVEARAHRRLRKLVAASGVA